jgi:hypothetical protein
MGDLDLEAHDAAGNRTAVGDGVVGQGGSVRVFGYSGAQNTYEVSVP